MIRTTLLASAALSLTLLGGLAAAQETTTEDTATDATAAEDSAAADTAAADDTAAPVVVEMAQGSPDAPITLIEYASFTCPHCANFHADQYVQLKEDYIDTGLVRFVFREVYFDRPGLWASMIARCGGEDRYFAIVDMLFDQQADWIAGGQDPALIAENLRRIGRTAGMDDATLDACLTDEAQAKALVDWFTVNMTEDEITATPTLMINGEKHSNMAYADLAALLDAELAE